jgi:hypothetical protein
MFLRILCLMFQPYVYVVVNLQSYGAKVTDLCHSLTKDKYGELLVTKPRI